MEEEKAKRKRKKKEEKELARKKKRDELAQEEKQRKREAELLRAQQMQFELQLQQIKEISANEIKAALVNQAPARHDPSQERHEEEIRRIKFDEALARLHNEKLAAMAKQARED